MQLNGLVQVLRDRLAMHMEPADFETAWTRGEKRDLKLTVMELLKDLE